jgi:hypothetical protein
LEAAVFYFRDRSRLFGHGSANFRHFGAALWTDTLNGRLAVFHFDLLGIVHFTLGFAFNAISFHLDVS